MAASGCGPAAAPVATPPTVASRPAAPVVSEAAAPATQAVEVMLVDHEGLMATVNDLRGKVVVLDCWSTFCPPCVKEFPGLVALAAKYPEDVVCLSLSFDYDGIGTPEEVLPPVREFLTGVGASGIRNMLIREEADVMYRKLELDSVPAIYVWAADGALARRFDDDDAAKRLGRPFTYADVEATVQALLR